MHGIQKFFLDLSNNLGVFAYLIVFLGVYPKPVLTRIQPSVDAVLAHVHDVTGYQQPAVATSQAATPGSTR